ncbi:MAG: ABC transporter ATP-binding protein [Candidatus Sericytochromatia bacterium]|nr:ABC transporter ATP-binding protein [Candidatus Sericytochromatia bacterium]
MAGEVIGAYGLTCHRGGRRALAGLDLAIPAGEVFALFGGNGAGKTTTISLFLGFVRPTAGTAFVAGVDVARRPLEARRRLAYVPESVSLYGHATPVENLRYFAALAGRRLSLPEARAALGRVGLAEEAWGRPLATLSKGMRQRCGLAIAFARQAAALFLDEPFSGLDPVAAAGLVQAIRGLRDEGCAVLVTTHDLYHARALADQVGIMRAGRLVRHLRRDALTTLDFEQLYREAMGLEAAPCGG